MAEEVQGVRAFGSETATQTVQGQVMERGAIHSQSLEATHEYSRIGAVKGIVTYADGSTLNLFTEFGVSQLTEIAWDLTNKTDHTITDIEALKSELATIRAQGFSTNNGEREHDIYAIAVPITTQHGKMISAFSVFGASPATLDQNRDMLLTKLQAAAQSAQHAIYGDA